MNAAELHAHIGSRWPTVLAQRGVAEEYLRGKSKPGPCPACGGCDRFFFDNRNGRGDWHCRHCEPHAGDGFDLLMKVTGMDFATVRLQVMQAAGLTDEGAPIIQRSAPTREPVSIYRPWRELAAHLWEQSQPIGGTVVQTYLERRGCLLPPENGDLRYLPARGEHPAAMLAKVTDVVTGESISLHFTALDADGNKVGDKPKRLLSGHRKGGGCIRLWPNDTVTHGLLVGEGIESVLAAAHAFRPVWAAIDAGNLGAFSVLAGVSALTIVADHDSAGIKAAQQCARRWAAAGREVRIARSRIAGQDAADVGAAA